MSERQDTTRETLSDPVNEHPRYEPPQIVWREAYEPVTSAVSCANQPGNPGCASGPVTA
jgi:hypothetical protein